VQCVILAGGLGTRMQAHDPTVPKTLLGVAGRPFAYWQLDWLAGQGVDEVVYCIGHLGGMVVDAVGTGERWGMTIGYLQEEEGALLGTGGAVRRAVDSGLLGPSFFVLYGDSYLQVDLLQVHRRFEALGMAALMTVFENDDLLDASNVILAGDHVARYDKGVVDPPPDMRFIDYGLTEVTARSVEAAFNPGEAADLAPYLSGLARDGQLGAFVVMERFYEVGSPRGLADLEAYLAGRDDPPPPNARSERQG
jgi:MurNAc alpha-1-phosphate uridylyltransferase